MTKKKNLIRDLSESELRGICGGHPPGGNEFGPFGSEPVANAFEHLNENAITGIVQGFVTRAPTCEGHQFISH